MRFDSRRERILSRVITKFAKQIASIPLNILYTARQPGGMRIGQLAELSRATKWHKKVACGEIVGPEFLMKAVALGHVATHWPHRRRESTAIVGIGQPTP
jgi:hypothetical protein